jgi:hypothetical protein
MRLETMVVRLVERCALWFSDPAERLQFLQRAAAPGASLEGRLKFTRTLGWALARRDFSRRFLPIAGVATLILCTLAATVIVQAGSRKPVSPASAVNSGRSHLTTLPRIENASASPAPRVWLVEARPGFDLYSNGLRVENQFATSTAPRKYVAFARGPQSLTGAHWRSDPAGIVFHTTESHMAPFEEDQNQTLERAGEGLLEYVCRRRAYHFVIDRFGRVYRIVRESDHANHAGHSIWADQSWIYINLNPIFFGIAFEAQTRREDEPAPLNAAQVHAGRILTDMLRARYGIAPENCVAHAQVSVNPGNRHAAYHTDWAAHLPFRDLGLADNYALPFPSIVLFGFATDPSLTQDGNPLLRQALFAAETGLEQTAAARGWPLERYRESLQEQYRQTMRALAAITPLEENN